MKKQAAWFIVAVLAVACAVAASEEKSWTGVVSDSHCGAKHATASDAAAACVTKCVSGGAKYVLVSEGKVYQLTPQEKFKGYAGKSVKVTGSEEKETITASEVQPAP